MASASLQHISSTVAQADSLTSDGSAMQGATDLLVGKVLGFDNGGEANKGSKRPRSRDANRTFCVNTILAFLCQKMHMNSLFLNFYYNDF